MRISDWERWLHVSSTIAVLIGVVLVILQLRQNAELIELQIMKDDANSYYESMQDQLPDNMLEISHKARTDPKSLTEAEFLAMDAELWSSTVVRWRGQYELAERGLLDDSVWRRTITEEAAAYFAYPFGRAYWARIKDWQTTLPTELIEYVDEVVAESPDHKPREQYKDVMRRLE